MTEATESGATIKVKINIENDEIEISEDKEVEEEEEEEEENDKGENSLNNVAEHYIINESDSGVLTVIKKDEDEDDETEEDLIEDNNDKVKEVIDHVCGKCFKTYSNVNRLQRHFKFCLTQTKIDNSKVQNEVMKEMENNIEKIEEDANEMEEKNICFCCKENFETCHSGHIRCYECPKSFKNAKSFERHVFLIHSGVEKFPCNVCNARCPTAGILELHRRSHSRGKPFACKKCGKEFTRRYHLYRHQQYSTCDNIKPKGEIICKVCGKIFYRVDNLRTHLRQHLRDAPKQRDYQCPYCDKSFYGTATLNIHIRSHTGERPFSCDLCDKSFPSNAALRKHRRSHTGEKPYSCSLCEKSFAAKEVLNRHMKIHTGERPHSCSGCGKSFIQATQLRNHIRLHHNTEPLICKVCSEEFSTSKLLKKHTKNKHSSEQIEMNQCDLCKEHFKTPGGLKRHISRIHKKSNLVCCDLKYSSKAEFDAHMASRHGVQTTQKSTNKKQKYTVETIELATIKAEDVNTNIKIEEYIIEEINEDEETNLVNSNENNETKEEEHNENISELANSENHSLMEIYDSEDAPLIMDEETLKKNIVKLLDLLLDKDILIKFGWPTTDVEIVLQKVIRNCGHTSEVLDDITDYSTKMREYVKLLFNVVIDNDKIKELLNNHSIDEVIDQVLKMSQVH